MRSPVLALCGFVAAFPAAAAGPTVVELFTSQSCYSCPPAEAFLGELADRADLIALELHVDYWNELVYGAAGKWKDPFSSAAHTRRQVGYNAAIKGAANGYTPQMVIDGLSEAVGSNRAAVLREIARAAADKRPRLAVDVARTATGGLSVSLDGAVPQPASVWLVKFLDRRTTVVRAGENRGKTLVNRHVVTAAQAIGEWTGTARTFDVAPLALADGEGCAVIVQDEATGPILGAALCPNPGS